MEKLVRGVSVPGLGVQGSGSQCIGMKIQSSHKVKEIGCTGIGRSRTGGSSGPQCRAKVSHGLGRARTAEEGGLGVPQC